MFDYIRNNTRLMGFLLALFIVPAFVLVGVDGYRNFTGRGETVATVAGFSIKKDRWDAAHRQDVDRIRASNPSVDAKLLDSDEVRFSSLERLVREQLLGSFAEKNHVQISDQRLAREIQRDPFIASLRQPDGSIDIARYREALARQGMTPALYEQNVRQDIEKSQVLQSVQTSGLVTPEIAKWALNPFFERRDVQFVRFQPAAYRSQIKTSDAEIEAFYDSNKRLFEAPEQVDVEYIVLDLPSVAQAIAISDVDVRSYYEQNANRYTTKEERRARHILLTLDAKASDKKTEIRQQMQVLSDQIKLNLRVETWDSFNEEPW
jgi:peptidyl-prolyl cis-trans isomerase D